MKEIRASVEWLAVAVITWLRLVSQPLTALNDFLELDTGGRQYEYVARVWLSASLIAMALSLPALSAYGITLGNLGYFASSFVLSVLFLVLEGFVNHLFLRAYRLKSSLNTTVAVYAITSSIYTPIFALFNIPIQFRALASVSTVRLQDLLTYMTQHLPAYMVYTQSGLASVSTMDTFYGLSSALVTYPLSVVSIVLYAETVTQIYDNKRFVVYSAVTLAQFVLWLSILQIEVGWDILTTYPFVSVR
jgi:hypothetical protein